MDAKSSAMSIPLCEKPILWGGQNVQLVLMISVSSEDRELFYDVFECLTMTISNPECYNKAIKADSLESFIDIPVTWPLMR